MAIFELEYRIHGYSVADAVHPNPRYGRRIFRVDGDTVGTNEPERIKALAIETAPEGYALHGVTASA